MTKRPYLEEIFRRAAKRAVNHDTREGAVQWRRNDHSSITFLSVFLTSLLFFAEVTAKSFGQRCIRFLLANDRKARTIIYTFCEVAHNADMDGYIILFGSAREREGTNVWASEHRNTPYTTCALLTATASKRLEGTIRICTLILVRCDFPLVGVETRTCPALVVVFSFLI